MVLFFLNHFVIPVEKICTASLVLFAGINSAGMLCDEKTRCGIMTFFNIEVSRKKKKENEGETHMQLSVTRSHYVLI